MVSANLEIFCRLFRRIVCDGTIEILLSPSNKPKYCYNRGSKWKRCALKFPAQSALMLDRDSSDQDIALAVSQIVTPDALYIVAHEFGHHLVANPQYERALKNCKLPVEHRNQADIDIVLNEEQRAWDEGFMVLESLDHTIPDSARELAKREIEGYRIGLAT